MLKIKNHIKMIKRKVKKKRSKESNIIDYRESTIELDNHKIISELNIQ